MANITTPVAPVQDTGPLDWRISIVDKSGRPTQEFQRRWAIQRNNNSRIGFVTVGWLPPIGVPQDGQGYVDLSAKPPIFYVGGNTTLGGNITWDKVGVQVFTDLKDVPGNYTSATGKLVRVNGNNTGLQFDTISTVLDSIGNASGDILYRGNATWAALPPSTAGWVLTTEGAGTPPVWAVAPATGVISVGLIAPSIFTVSGSPVTGSGNLTFTLNNESANTVFSGPVSGSPASPTFRGLVPADLPVFTTSLAGAVSASGGGTVNFLRADGTWVAPPGNAVTIQGNGTTLTSAVTVINFTTNLTATAVGSVVTVSATGGGGSSGAKLPLVNGDKPGPAIMSDPTTGQTIGVPV